MDPRDYVSAPNLQQMAVIKVATAAWDAQHVRAQITGFSFDNESDDGYEDRRQRWRAIENDVIESVNIENVPITLRPNILRVINGIGNQIRLWWKFHSHDTELVSRLPKELFWTLRGSIDLKRTAELFLEEPRLLNFARYKLACVYCIEKQIQKLFPKINKDRALTCEIRLVRFWTRNLIEEDEGILFYNAYDVALLRATDSGNVAATRFFWDRLEPQQKDPLSAYYAARNCHRANSWDFPSAFHSDVVFYLLSRLDRNQLKAHFEKGLSDTLQRALSWPWQHLFLHMATDLKDRISEQDFRALTTAIAEKMERGCRDYDYGGLFVRFWALPTPQVRSLALRNFSRLSWIFVKSGEAECLSLVLKDRPDERRSGVVLHDRGMAMCERWLGQPDRLQGILSACLPTRTQLVAFRAAYAERNEKMYGEATVGDVEKLKLEHEKFNNILENLITGKD